MTIVDKILQESTYDDFMRYARTGRKPRRLTPSSDEDAKNNFLKSKVGDIVKVNDLTVVLLSPISYTPRSRHLVCSVVEHRNLAQALKTGKGAAVTLTLRAVKAFNKVGKIKPSEVDVLLGKKQEIEKRVAEKVTSNYNAINYNHDLRQYEVTMQDGNKAVVGDKVVVKFSNGKFDMVITKIAGTKTGEIMVIDPWKANKPGLKSRGMSPEKILRKSS